MNAGSSRRILLRNASAGTTVRLSREESHHIAGVLRMKPGDTLVAFTPGGRRFRAEINAIERDCVWIAVGDELEKNAVLPQARILLLFSPPRPKRSDWLVEKATELGVSVLQPVIFERTQGQMELMARKRLIRWGRIAKEAAEQSGRCNLPDLNEPVRWPDLVQSVQEVSDGAVRLIACINQHGRPILSELLSLPGTVEEVAIAIGPEGGITQRETELACESGFRPVSLGPTVLRTETAAMVAASAAVLAVALTG